MSIEMNRVAGVEILIHFHLERASAQHRSQRTLRARVKTPRISCGHDVWIIQQTEQKQQLS